jgi:hypothetical protein
MEIPPKTLSSCLSIALQTRVCVTALSPLKLLPP